MIEMTSANIAALLASGSELPKTTIFVLDPPVQVPANGTPGCTPVAHYTCMCRGTRRCGCRLTNPPTHFHDDGRYAGHTCPSSLAP